MTEFPSTISGRLFAGAFVGCIAGVLLLLIGMIRFLLFIPGGRLTMTLEDVGVAAALIVACAILGALVGAVSPLARGTVRGWVIICCSITLGLLLILYLTGVLESSSTRMVASDIIAATLMGGAAAVSAVFFWRRT